MNKCEHDCEKCQHRLCARRVPIFSTLDDKELRSVSDLIVRKHYLKGEQIILEGSNMEGLTIINSGQVKAYKYTQEGKEQILYIFSTGDFFGEKNLLRKKEVTYNVEALEETRVCVIRKNDFMELLRGYPEIGLKIMEVLCNRIDSLENAIKNMGTKNVESRVNAALLEFSVKFGRQHPKGIMIELPLSREGIANYIGAARETVSRRLSNLQEQGIIEMVGNKRVILLDKSALENDSQ